MITVLAEGEGSGGSVAVAVDFVGDGAAFAVDFVGDGAAFAVDFDGEGAVVAAGAAGAVDTTEPRFCPDEPRVKGVSDLTRLIS